MEFRNLGIRLEVQEIVQYGEAWHSHCNQSSFECREPKLHVTPVTIIDQFNQPMLEPEAVDPVTLLRAGAASLALQGLATMLTTH